MDHADSAQYQKMTASPIPRLITTLALPTIASMLTTAIYNMADTYFVSHLGKSATGAVGVVFSLMAIIQAVGFALGMGSGSLISRLLGHREKDQAEEVAASGLLGALVLGLCITTAGLLFLDPLMRLLGATETILPHARAYAGYILYGAPVMAASFVLNNLLRAEGHAALAMVGITTGGVLNIVLDPIFIFVLNQGIAGAAQATLLSQCVSFLLLLSAFLRGKSILRLSLGKASRNPRLYWGIVRAGLPSFCRQGLASIATASLNGAAGLYGDAAIAAMSVVGRVFMLIMSVLIGFGQGYQPVVGYNYGAGRYDRVRQAFLFTLTASLALMAVLCTAGLLAAPQVIGLFADGDAEVLSIGVFAMRAQCIGLLFQPIGTSINMTFQSIGRTWESTFLSLCRQGIYFLPLIWLLPRLWGLTGVELTQPLADLLTCATSVPFQILFFRQLKALQAAQTPENRPK